MELEEILRMLEEKGYSIEKDVSRKFEFDGEVVEIYANAVAVAEDRYVMVRREEDNRPLAPLERFSVAVARLLGVKGYAVSTNGFEAVCLRVDNGERTNLESIPPADEAKSFNFEFDEEKELRIAVAIGKLRCPCRQGECRL